MQHNIDLPGVQELGNDLFKHVKFLDKINQGLFIGYFSVEGSLLNFNWGYTYEKREDGSHTYLSAKSLNTFIFTNNYESLLEKSDIILNTFLLYGLLENIRKNISIIIEEEADIVFLKNGNITEIYIQ